MIFKKETRSIPITIVMVWGAYKLVKKNKGSAGINKQTLEEFEKVRSKELYNCIKSGID